VIRTRVGYAGGEKPNPTYHSLGDHTETIQIDYGPERVNYAELLDIFWRSHDPTNQPYARQYMSIVFFHDQEQEKLAEQTKAAIEEQTGRTVLTELRPAAAFHRAEDYHQKYSLRRHRDLLGELTAAYPDAADLTDSTAAARINGFLAGEGKAATLQSEIDSYGLSQKARDKLLALVPRLD